ncbi:MAG: hypothetical protein ABI205_12345 [Gemmatimonadaceae bacterium]
MSCRRVAGLVLPALVAVFGATHSATLGAQQSDVSLTPFVGLPTNPSTGTVAGLGLTMAGNSSFGLRGSGRVALKNTYGGTFGVGSWLPPWGADVDAVFAMSGRPFGTSNRRAATFAFLGAGASATDTVEARLVHKNWSYGVGTILPLGAVADLFAETRWRMEKFVLPTAKPRPTKSKEYRFGVSFHLRSANGSPGRTRQR